LEVGGDGAGERLDRQEAGQAAGDDDGLGAGELGGGAAAKPRPLATMP
jgi:hypothetical protein